ncbi:hypothetical protein PHLCEN_2v1187 [Hermanssonia centrifuga]|uniref:Uncharacterized protein n=1 Tax=Hermanssonia centrifuga TaxID=98765 RepID=A0A2R6S3W1_9APHY|nr:hypothetical protein PHLCEN_2v1187 [Hermanssonia centrifuga]
MELRMTAHELTFGIEELGKRAVTVQANRAAKSQADLFKELTQIHKEIKGRKAMLIKVAQAMQTIGMMSTAPGGIGYHNGPAGQGTQSVNSMPGGQPTPNLYPPPPSPPASHLATLIGVDPQEANQLVLLSKYPADELRQRGISGHIVDKVELHRAVLQRTLQGQTSFPE